MAITDPRDIPGLVAWYSAEAETGYSDGAQMTGWNDLSGLGNHAVAVGATAKPLWQAASGPAGGAAVRYQGGSAGGYFALPNLMSGMSAGEALVSLRFAGSDSTSDLWVFGAGSDAYTSCAYVFSGTVYERFGRGNSGVGEQRAVFTPGVTVTDWRRYNVWSAPDDWAARFDGTSRHTDVTNVVAWATTPALGATMVSGAIRTTNKWSGYMSAFLLYSRKLTTTERADLDAWLVANPSGGVPGSSASTGSLAAALPVLTADLAGAYAPPLVTGSLASTLPAVSASFAGTYTATGAPVTGTLAAVLPGLTVSLSGTYTEGPSDGSISTDLTWDNDGYNYTGLARVFYDPPVAEPPAHVRRTKVRQVHQSMPVPTLVDGRPT